MPHATAGSALVLILALALTACGDKTETADTAAGTSGGAETAGAASATDPCSYISTAEVAAITTDAVSEATREDDSCTYHSKPDGGVRVVVMTSGGRTQMETQRRAADVLQGMGGAMADTSAAGKDAEQMLKKDGTATPAIGDEAMWGTNAMLAVRKGDGYVEVWPPIIHDPATHKGYPLLSDQEKRSVSEAVARKVLAKLGG